MGKIVTLKHSGNGGGPRSAAAKHSNNGGGAKPAISTMVAEARKKLVASAEEGGASRQFRLERDPRPPPAFRRAAAQHLAKNVGHGNARRRVEWIGRSHDARTECGTRHAVPERSRDERALLARCPGQLSPRDPAAQQQRHRRPRVHDGRAASSSTTPTPTRASTAAIDEQTGFMTRSILCVPIRTAKGEIIGVAQVLNKREGEFTQERHEAAGRDDDAGHAGAPKRAVHRAHESDPQAGARVPRHRVGGDRPTSSSARCCRRSWARRRAC